jgi:predicted RNase H-like nuclease (RuvC/YqgF family)
LCQEIEAVVQSKNSDRSYYQQQMAALYHKYFKCMSENKRNNHTLSGIDEIERHIGHIDREIDDVNRKTDGTIRRRDEEIQRATQENADLIKELTASREERTKLTLEFKNVQKMGDNLTRQIKQIKNMAQQGKPAETSTLIKKSNVDPKPLPAIQPLNLVRSSSQPIVKGKISRGVNYDPGSLSIFTRAKLK